MTVAVIAAAVIVLFLLILAVIYLIAFYTPHPHQNEDRRLPAGEQFAEHGEAMNSLIDELLTVPFERVSIRSRDGLRLSARYYRGREGAPVAVCCHGYRGTAIRDFCGGAGFLLGQGYHVLLVEQRGAGQSEGHTITMGVKERWDCRDWAVYAAERFGSDTPIALYGTSMGAATVLMAADCGLPENVVCIVADAPYSSPREIVESVCRSAHLPVRLFYPLAAAAARLYGGFSLTGADAAQAVGRSSIPAIIIHGEDDRLVPCFMSERIAAARPEGISRHTFPGAGHCLSYLIDHERYISILEKELLPRL